MVRLTGSRELRSLGEAMAAALDPSGEIVLGHRAPNHGARPSTASLPPLNEVQRDEVVLGWASNDEACVGVRLLKLEVEEGDRRSGG